MIDPSRLLPGHPDETTGSIIFSGHAVVHPYPGQNNQRPSEG